MVDLSTLSSRYNFLIPKGDILKVTSTSYLSLTQDKKIGLVYGKQKF